jgi:hypothetical protein
MTIQPDPAYGTLVEREGVNAGSDRSTEEGDTPVASPESALSPGATTGRPDTTPSQAWSEDTGGVVDPEAGYGSESGQDVGSAD